MIKIKKKSYFVQGALGELRDKLKECEESKL